jgi:hypothetical protein
MRRILALLLGASLLACVSFGCGTEKRIKECVARCEAEGQACERRREPNCAVRGRECAEACQRQ